MEEKKPKKRGRKAKKKTEEPKPKKVPKKAQVREKGVNPKLIQATKTILPKRVIKITMKVVIT